MINTSSDIKEVWTTILLFIINLIVLSSIAYFAILKLNPTSMYVGALMLTPTLAAFITLVVRKRSITSLPWGINNIKYLKYSYYTPVLYVSIAYFLIWLFGFGDIFNAERITKWSNELGIETTNNGVVMVVMILLLLSVGVVKNMGSVLGEEIGWRGFLIYELRKVMSFKALAIISGIIWAVWHYPLINLIYGRGDYLLLHIVAFTIMIVGISVILAYYTFKSNSLWPAAIFHSIHNIYIQKVCTPLFISNNKTEFWIDEYGFMIPIVTTIFAVYFWIKAEKEKL